MIVKDRALIIGVNNPTPILDAIPTAKHIRYKDADLVAVRHTLDAAKVLRNLGLNAPSPILHDGYEFTGRFSPMENQFATAEFLTLNNRAFVFNEMRTGKTGSTLWALDYLRKRGHARRILVVCPLSVMDVWSKEAFSIVPHLSLVQLTGKKDKRIELAHSNASISVINFDGLSSLYHEEYKEGTKTVVKRWSDLDGLFDLIIVDEASAYCNAQSLRYKALKQLLKPDIRLWLLTGTPTPNAPTDAYGLAKLVCPERIPASFTLFRELLMKPAGPYKWIPKPGAKEKVMALLQPAIRFTRKECKDLPTTHQNLHCEMSATQKKVFEDVKAKMRHEDKQVEVSAVNAAVKLIKLQQVMCGVVKDDDGNPFFLDPKPRLDLLLETIKEADAKVVVYVPFIHAMHMVQNFLLNHFTCELVNGEVPKAKRDEIFRNFQNTSSPHVLVAHPKVASHGKDLTAADTFIWFAPVFSTEQYEQANARGEGPNKTKPVGIYHIGCHPVEWRIYSVLQNKVGMQSELLDMYEEMMK